MRSCYPGQHDGWGWQAGGQYRLNGVSRTSEKWKIDDTLILELNTQKMIVTPGRVRAGHRSMYPPVNLPAGGCRPSGAFHFSAGRYHGKFTLQIVSLELVDTLAGAAKAGEGKSPIAVYPVLASKMGIASYAYSKPAPKYELVEPITCKLLSGSEPAGELLSRAEAISLVRRLMSKGGEVAGTGGEAGAEGGADASHALIACEDALEAAASEGPSLSELHLAIGVLHTLSAREDVPRRGALGTAAVHSDAALSTGLLAHVLDAELEKPVVARLLETLEGDVEVTVCEQARSQLFLALPTPALTRPQGERLLAAIGKVLDRHLARSGVTNADGATAHVSLTLTTLSMLAVESLLAMAAVNVSMLIANRSLLNATLAICAAPIPPVPTLESGQWMGRRQLWGAAVGLANALPATAPPTTVSLLVSEGDRRATAAYRVSCAALPFVNGEYVHDGQYQGAPRFVHAESGEIYLLRYSLGCGASLPGSGRWCLCHKDQISSVLSDDDGEYYYIASDSMLPPDGSVTWQTAEHGLEPVPQVERVASSNDPFTALHDPAFDVAFLVVPELGCIQGLVARQETLDDDAPEANACSSSGRPKEKLPTAPGAFGAVPFPSWPVHRAEALPKSKRPQSACASTSATSPSSNSCTALRRIAELPLALLSDEISPGEVSAASHGRGEASIAFRCDPLGDAELAEWLSKAQAAGYRGAILPAAPVQKGWPTGCSEAVAIRRAANAANAANAFATSAFFVMLVSVEAAAQLAWAHEQRTGIFGARLARALTPQPATPRNGLSAAAAVRECVSGGGFDDDEIDAAVASRGISDSDAISSIARLVCSLHTVTHHMPLLARLCPTRDTMPCTALFHSTALFTASPSSPQHRPLPHSTALFTASPSSPQHRSSLIHALFHSTALFTAPPSSPQHCSSLIRCSLTACRLDERSSERAFVSRAWKSSTLRRSSCAKAAFHG